MYPKSLEQVVGVIVLPSKTRALPSRAALVRGEGGKALKENSPALQVDCLLVPGS
jgi:hypothetical protein